MRVRTLYLACLLLCMAGLAVGAPQAETKVNADSLSGAWTGDWGPSATDRNKVTVELQWDGKTLTGTINPGADAVTLKKCTYDAETAAVHMEAETKNEEGKAVHYVIDGEVEDNTITGTWNHDDKEGDFKITKK